ncbi:MAG TPA: hypothetical protein VMM37_06535 [Bacteroidota bacterium]|nr:hypothetical protein [Bacteroidota bacterium]
MDSGTLHKKYLSAGTPGYAIVQRFQVKYADVLLKSGFSDVDDILHEILLSLSRSDYSRVVNIDHYVMRAIKLHCWTLLDKALRIKSVMTSADSDLSEENDRPDDRKAGMSAVDGSQTIEGMELLSYVNLFKAELNQRDVQLLNLLIDETERSDIARRLELNLNTLDTSIRRLRIRLAEFLHGLGYTYKALDRFVQN